MHLLRLPHRVDDHPAQGELGRDVVPQTPIPVRQVLISFDIFLLCQSILGRNGVGAHRGVGYGKSGTSVPLFNVVATVLVRAWGLVNRAGRAGRAAYLRPARRDTGTPTRRPPGIVFAAAGLT